MTHAREVRELIKGVKYEFDQTVSRIDVFIGNIIPEVIRSCFASGLRTYAFMRVSSAAPRISAEGATEP